MEEINENLSPINSDVKTAVTNNDYSNKKRKFQEEQLVSPKHKCFQRTVLSSECDPPLNQAVETKEFQTGMINDDIESVKDSNSFITDSDSSTSEPDFLKTFTYDRDRPSTSSGYWADSSFKKTTCSDNRIVTNMGERKEELTYMVVGQYPEDGIGKFQEYRNLEDDLLRFEEIVGYSCSDFENECKGKEHEDMPSSSGTNQKVYVLSSGRWSVNPESQHGTKKPTIDQEFEQYFSSLMLH